MKKKSIALCAVTTLFAGSVIVPTASAQYIEGQPVEYFEGIEYHTTVIDDGNFQTISEDISQKFIQIKGTISKITEESKGNFYVEVKSEDPFNFYFNKDTIILNNAGEKTELKEGMEFIAFVDSSKPMIMIYPPRYSPEVIIAQTKEEGTVQLDQFDKNFLNKNKDLKIKLDKQTVISDLSGKKLSAEDIVNKEVLIFYNFVLESYPMQTGPSKVIVLEKEVSKKDLAYEIAEQDNYVVNGVKMVPLRLIAEQLGYKVEATKSGAIISKGAFSITITRGSKMYGYNKAIRYFEVEPALLEKGKTYVPYELLETLVVEE